MKICINVGHTLSGPGSGAVGIKNEGIENRKVADAVVNILKNMNHNVILSKVDKASSTSEYLNKCVNIANKSGATLFVSIHFNSFNGNANAVETFIYKGNKKNSAIGSRICNKISSLGYKNRGVKDGSNLYVLSHTSMDAILVECCFIDNTEDMKKYDTFTMAKAICEGILNNAVNV